jgi:hypothetical protein
MVPSLMDTLVPQRVEDADVAVRLFGLINRIVYSSRLLSGSGNTLVSSARKP